MTNLIKIDQNVVNQIINQKNNYVINYPTKNWKKIDMLLKRLEDGCYSESEAVRLSEMTKPTYYAIKKIGEFFFHYCEENNINYENTIYSDVVKCFLNIEKAYLKGTEKMIKIIEKASNDEYDEYSDEKGNTVKKLVKKGDWKAVEFILKNARRKEYRDIEEEIIAESKRPLVVINTNGQNLKEIALLSQQNLVKRINNNEE